MTYALTLIKGSSGRREEVISLFNQFKEDPTFKEKYHVDIKKILISFGWPDIILLLQGPNIELIKRVIVVLREEAANIGDDLTTSTIICTTQEEMASEIKKWG